MVTQQSLSIRAWSELGLIALIWGASFLSIRVALNEIAPLTAVAHRTGWAMIVLWVFVCLKRLPVPTAPRVWGAFLMMGLLNNVIPFTLMAWGQLHIETGLTSILNAATAIFGVIAAALFFQDERLTFNRGLGVVVGFIGVCTAIGADALRSIDIRSLGQLAVVIGTISYALASVWARKKLSGLAPQVAAAGMLTGSSMVMIPLAYLVDGAFDFNLAPRTWVAIGYYALPGTAIAYLLYYRVLAMAGSGNLMLSTLLIAPIAIVLGAVFLGEELPIRAYYGFALLALGLVIIDGRLLQRRENGSRCT